MTTHAPKHWIVRAIAIIALAVPALASEPAGKSALTAETANIRAAVKAYHHALKSGDRAAAIAMLADDLMVQEGGWIETYDEYLAHHLDADMEFSSGVPGTHEVLQAVVSGNTGWVVSKSTAKGTFREHDINSAGAELIVLGKSGDTWKIRAIHWSSRKLKE